MEAPCKLKGWNAILSEMKSMHSSIDYMFVSDLDKHGLVYYAETDTGGLMCGGSEEHEITAVIIGDKPEELASFIANIEGEKPKIKQTTLFSLCDDWRFFMYRESCRMIVAGDGWLSRAVGEMATWGSRLCSDPACSVLSAKVNGQPARIDGAIVIAQDIADLLDVVGSDIDTHNVEFLCSPLITFAMPDETVWYQGNTYRVRETLERNMYMLSKFVDTDQEAELLRKIERNNEN
jgi:hypothetical protein